MNDRPLRPQRAKALSEWRSAEAKNKSKCYANAKDNERVQDAVLDCKLGRGREDSGHNFCDGVVNERLFRKATLRGATHQLTLI